MWYGEGMTTETARIVALEAKVADLEATVIRLAGILELAALGGSYHATEGTGGSGPYGWGPAYGA